MTDVVGFVTVGNTKHLTVPIKYIRFLLVETGVDKTKYFVKFELFKNKIEISEKTYKEMQSVILKAKI
jgi:hypothetical protein